MSTILGNLKSLFLSLRNRRSQDSVEGNSATSMNEQFRFRYALFKDLLNANTELLKEVLSSHLFALFSTVLSELPK